MNGLVSRLRQNAKRRAAYRSLVDELSFLTPRELADIGIGSNQIHDIARAAVYGQ
jgi:uncharacterized protein YjiS (DUF1127 family)